MQTAKYISEKNNIRLNVDGESKIEVNKRILEFLNKVLIKHNGMKIAVVTYGAALKFLFSTYCLINDNAKLTYNNKELEFTSPSVFRLTFDKDKYINLEQIW